MWRTLLIIGLLLSACKDPQERKCLKGSGEHTQVIRQLEPFNELHLHDQIDYTLIQDSLDQVVIRCGENLIELVSTDVSQGKLKIIDENSCHWLRALPIKIEVDVHYSSLNHIISFSSGEIRTLGPARGEQVDFDIIDNAGTYNLAIEATRSSVQVHAGGPHVTVTGHSQHMDYYNNSVGIIDAEGFTSTSAWVDNKSDGEIYCTLGTGILWYMLDGLGNTYYRGEPDVIEEVSRLGSGQLIKLD